MSEGSTGQGEVATDTTRFQGAILAYATFTRDSLGRILTKVDSSNGATYSYNGLGQLVSHSNASGTTRYHYDLGGSLLSVRLPNGDSVAYTLDPTGRRIARSLNGAVSNRWQQRRYCCRASPPGTRVA